MTVLFALVLFCITLNAQCKKHYDYLYEGLPFTMEKVCLPDIPDNRVSLTEYGGRGDGMTLNTQAFASAINSLSEKGGGTLVVSQGVWLTGPIVMKSKINLHLESGAIILFSEQLDLYPVIETNFEGVRAKRCQSPISGSDLHDIAITGNGIIDGNGRFWRPLKREKVTENQWKALTSTSGTVKDGRMWYPDNNRVNIRPNMLSLTRCKNVLLQGVTFKDSPCWNLHPLMCENVTIDGVTVKNPGYAQNGDGLDLESCRNAVIVNTLFDVGDDAICIKSGRDKEGRERGMPTENVIVSGCTVYSGHGGFVIGSEMSGGARNISVSNCQFLGTDNGLRFKSTRGRGGTVEKIYIRNISMTDISGDAIRFNLHYGTKFEPNKEIEKLPVDETTPSFRDIHIESVSCNGADHAFFFNGLPEMPVRDIFIDNVNITASNQSVFKYCENIKQNNVNVVVK